MSNLLKIVSINVRGLRNETKRRSILQQIKGHCDCVLLQETHLDPSLANAIPKEFPGQWSFSNGSSRSAGVGIGIFGFGIKMTEEQEHISEDGRLIGKLITINKQSFYLLSAYAPCTDTSQASRVANLELLRRAQNLMVCQRALGHTVVLGGDLNFIRDIDLDAIGGNPRVHEPQANWLNYLESNVGFQDVSRFLFPEDKMMTWAPTGRNKRGIHRRLDYMITDTTTMEKVSHHEVIASARSDHRLLVTHINLGREKVSGPGLWRHNDTLLCEDEYCKIIEDVIEKEKKEKLSNARFRWEWIKYKAREAAKRFSKERAKKRREEKCKLEEKYAKAIEAGNNGSDAEEARAQLEKYFQEEDESIRFRAQVDEVECGEKISAYFYRTISQRRQESNIDSIKTDEFPTGTKDRAETMTALHSHFKRTFQDDKKYDEVDSRWWEKVPKINDELKESLDRPITRNDLTMALFKNMSPSKAPGNDGLTVKFMRKFWLQLSPLLMDSLKESWEHGELSNSQKESVIRLIAKKDKDQSKISGHRPISLINVDAKIYSKCLSERLRKLTNEVVDHDQLAYMEGRSVHDGHMLINRMLELGRSNKVKGLMATVDFRGAFDSIRHQFIWDTLEKMNVGPNLINHLKTLYKNTKSAILNYGTQTAWFPLERSTRQGDPVAGHLFIIVMQVLLKRLEACLSPMAYKNFTLCLIAYADDLTLFLQNDEQLLKALGIITDFKSMSGLAINLDKSEVLEIGVKTRVTAIKVCSQVKITGIHFMMDGNKMITNNWEYAMKRVKDKIRGWQGRCLTEIGKSILIKTVIMPIIAFTGSIVQLPDKTEKELTTIMFEFLWGRTDKITRALAHQNKEYGGLGIPVIRAKLEAYHATWIGKLPGEDKPWTKIFFIEGIDWSQEGILNNLIQEPNENCHATRCIKAWNGMVALLEPQEHDLRITPYLQSEIRGIMKRKAPTLTFRQVEERMLEDTDLNFLEKQMLLSSLDRAKVSREDTFRREACNIRDRLFHKITSKQKWPKRLVPGSAVEVRHNENVVKYGGMQPCSIRKQRDIYNIFMSQLVPPMNKFRSRIEANLGIEVNWKQIDCSNLFISTKLQSFNWRSTHGLIYTNKDYKRFGVKEEEKCHCGDIQTLEHLMLQCQRSKMLFANFQVQFKMQEKLTDTEKLMGIDPTVQRTKGLLKKLAILRNEIIMSNYRDEVLRWPMVLHKIDRTYTLEYAVANRHEKLHMHFKSWDM